MPAVHSFLELVYRISAAIKLRRHALPSDSIFAGHPTDRFQSRLALYQWACQHCRHRSVVDLLGGTGLGAAALLDAGALSLECRVRSQAELDYARSTTDHDCFTLSDGSQSPGTDLRAERGPSEKASNKVVLLVDDGSWEDTQFADPSVDSLLSGGSTLILGRSASGGKGNTVKAVERWLNAVESALDGKTLQLRRYRQLPPEGYLPNFGSSQPARARAQEYRFERLSPKEELGDACGVVLIAAGRPPEHRDKPIRLHVGSGVEHLDGWLNVDLLPLPGVDLVLDVTEDFHFSNAEALYAEHFIEHLAIEDALGFLVNAHAALQDGGKIRLSTPNLDWVWRTHYAADGDEANKVERAIYLNRAFYGWGHQFVWNREMISVALRHAGFRDLTFPKYGESRWPEFQGIERHEQYDDFGPLRHVLIVEALRGDAQPTAMRKFKEHLDQNFGAQLREWDGFVFDDELLSKLDDEGLASLDGQGEVLEAADSLRQHLRAASREVPARDD